MVSLDDLEEKLPLPEWKALGSKSEWTSPALELEINYLNPTDVKSLRKLNPDYKEVTDDVLLKLAIGERRVKIDDETYRLFKRANSRNIYQLKSDAADTQRALHGEVRVSVKSFERSKKSNPSLSSTIVCQY
jgi:hypothetical protein